VARLDREVGKNLVAEKNLSGAVLDVAAIAGEDIRYLDAEIQVRTTGSAAELPAETAADIRAPAQEAIVIRSLRERTAERDPQCGNCPKQFLSHRASLAASIAEGLS
jgi:hypothetical protein